MCYVFFSKQRCSVRPRTTLFQTYCNSRYGCELWSLYDSSISDFGAAWRKAVRRILNIPPDTHNYLIPLLLHNASPFLDDVCKRSARFVFSCIQSSLVRSIAKHSIFESRCNSVIGKNAAFLCSHFGWQLVKFVYSRTDLSNSGFLSYFYNQVSGTEWCETELLKDVLSTRDGWYCLPMAGAWNSPI